MKVFSRECNTMNAAFVHASVNPPPPPKPPGFREDRQIRPSDCSVALWRLQWSDVCTKLIFLFLCVMLLVPMPIAHLCTDNFLPVLLIELSLLRHDYSHM
jgi:hypothetical protein